VKLSAGRDALDERGQPGLAEQVRGPLGTGRRSGRWYVNFERPHRRTPSASTPSTWFLDPIVEPSLSAYTWKDKHEYAHARRLGLIDDTLHAHVEAARQHVLALIGGREGPFAQDWSRWRRDPRWPAPHPPPGAMDAPAQA